MNGLHGPLNLGALGNSYERNLGAEPLSVLMRESVIVSPSICIYGWLKCLLQKHEAERSSQSNQVLTPVGIEMTELIPIPTNAYEESKTRYHLVLSLYGIFLGGYSEAIVTLIKPD